MLRLRVLGILALGVVSACGPTVPSPTAESPPQPSAIAMLTQPPLTTPHGTDVASLCEFAATYPFGAATIDLYPTYEPEGGADGGSMVVATTQPITRFDPLAFATGGDLLLSQAVWRGLARESGDYQVIPDLARVVPELQNGLVTVDSAGHAMSVTWCLRSNLAWSDGQPLSCSDFQYTLDWLRGVDPEAAPRFGSPVAVDCPTDTIAIIRYGSIFSSYYSRALPPLPRHVLAARSLADLRAGEPFSAAELPSLPTSGPFQFRAVDPGHQYDLVRNPHYGGGAFGKAAHLDALRIDVLRTSADAIQAFQAGQAQLVEGLDPADLANLERLGLHDSIAAAPSLAVDSLRFNLSPGLGDGSGGCSESPDVASRGQGCPTADETLRRAIREALDTSAIASVLAPSDGEQVFNSIIPPQAWFFADIGLPPTDAAAARNLLAANGWVDTDRDGYVEHDGTTATIELCTTGSPGRRAAVQLIQGELAGIGIRVVPHVVADQELEAPYALTARTAPCALSRGNFDVALVSEPTFLEPGDFRVRYDSHFFEPVGVNDGRIADPAIDAALDAAASTLDFSAIKDAMAQFQQAVIDGAVEITLGARKNVALVEFDSTQVPAFGNYFQSPTSSDTWNAEDWYMRVPFPTPSRGAP